MENVPLPPLVVSPHSRIYFMLMNVSRSGNKKGDTFYSTAELTPTEIRSSACKMACTLVQLMQTLDKMLDEPVYYKPPFFRGCTEQEAHHPWTKNPLRVEFGNVSSTDLVSALKVKSVLHPLRVKDWISCYHLQQTDILSTFPDRSWQKVNEGSDVPKLTKES